MTKCEINDQALMMTSAAAIAVCGVHGLVHPKSWQDMQFTADVPRSAEVARLGAHSTAAAATVVLLSGLKDNMTTKGKKDMNKVLGACWGSVAAHQGYLMQQKKMKTDAFTIGNAVIGTTLAGLHLYQGFKKDKAKASSTTTTTSTAKK